MTEFIVEMYLPNANGVAAADAAVQARSAAEQLTREGTPVRYLCALFMPGDETCFHLFEALSAGAASLAATRAGLPIDRVAPVVFIVNDTDPAESQPAIDRAR